MKGYKVRTEIYSRVVGYFRPVSQWNKGKSEEFIERRVFNLDNSIKIKDNCRGSVCTDQAGQDDPGTGNKKRFKDSCFR